MINKQLTNRRNLTTIERERIVQLQDVNSSDKSLLGHLIIKYLQFNAENKLNSEGEFYQTYDDIRNAMMSCITDNPLRAQLKRLTKVGYITYQYKGIESDKLHRKAIHLTVTDKAINAIMGDNTEFNSNPKDKYEILQKVRYKYKEKKEFTPEVFSNKNKN